MHPSVVTLALAMKAEPPAAVSHIERAAQEAGAMISAANRFSNKALAFTLELTRSRLPELERSLGALGPLEVGWLAPDSTREIVALLHVTLVHDAPELRVPVPKVPG